MYLKKIYLFCLMQLWFSFACGEWVPIAEIDLGENNKTIEVSEEPILEEKCIIGARGAGFFSEFFMVINWLVYAKKYNLTPLVYWDNKSLYYQKDGYKGNRNAWEYYFKQVSDAPYDENDFNSIKREYAREWGINSFDQRFVESIRHYVKSVINEYIDIQPWIQEKKDDFYNKYMRGKKTVGIHVRGTDKHFETAAVPRKQWLKIAKDIAAQFPGCQFLVATDEIEILKFLKRFLPGRVIYYRALRSENNQPVHYHNSMPARAGEDVLVEVMLLSECDFFIHGQSNVAIAALFFNPNMPHMWLKAPGSSRSISSFDEANMFISLEEECFFSYCWEF